MFINLTNIDFCPGSGGGSANLQEGKSVTYTTNGNYTINPDEGYDGLSSVGVTVNYNGTDYRNQTGTVDVDGLRAIGWDETSINYFNANALHYPWENDNYKVTDGNKALYGVIDSSNISNYRDDPNFIYCPYFDTSSKTNMDSMFEYCSRLKSIPLLNTSNVTSMGSMFYSCSTLTTIPLIDTSNVTLMESMFSYCVSLKNIPQLDTSSVESMRSMFYNCTSLKTIPQLNTSNVTSMYNMFSHCESIETIPQLDTSKVTNMYQMFGGCTSLKTIPQLDTSKVTTMSSMFEGCTSLKTIPQLNTSNVTSMYNMFYNCKSIETIPQLDTSKVTSMNSMFGGIYWSMNLRRIEGLDMSSVTNADSMFDGRPDLSYIRLNGSLNISLDISITSKLDYDSVKSVLTAASNTVNTDSKTLSFNSTLTDQNGELATLVSTCTSKGWTINGLTLS